MRYSSHAVARLRWGVRLLVLASLALSTPLHAQQEEEREDPIEQRIEESQRRLERIKSERERLREEMRELTNRVHAVEDEIANLERQIGRSASAVAEIRIQINSLEGRVRETTRELLLTRDRLTAARMVLRRRLTDIYKRGKLTPVQVLLESSSFSDLIHRYKYLRMVTLHDRILVNQVMELESRLGEHREQMARELARLRSLREERVDELDELEHLERERRRRLRGYESRRSEAQSRITQLAREEEKLRGLLDDLERARREAERRAGRAEARALTTDDLGDLDWPVEGEILYQFGPERRDGTTLAREGIGISAAAGTPVRSVEAGEVVLAETRGLYGPSVIVSHGGGYYTLYLYLRDLTVREGDRVRSGEVVGHVGGRETPEGAHVEFQIREPNPAGQPRAVDPLEWLRKRR